MSPRFSGKDFGRITFPFFQSLVSSAAERGSKKGVRNEWHCRLVGKELRHAANFGSVRGAWRGWS